MTDPVYVIVFDQIDPNFDPVALRDAVRDNTGITHWWNHIPNCFLVSTELSAADLTTWLRKYSSDVGFFVMEADPRNSEGYLPTRSWKWIQSREQERSTVSA